MKMSLVLLSLFLGSLAQAEIISSKTVDLPVDLSTAGIRLSKAGYSMPTVKVLIPELAAVTVMNHRNEGETAPCVATYQAIEVEEVVQGLPTIETVPFTITLEKSVRIDHRNNSCAVTLVETVEGVVRGFTFSHIRQSPLPSRHIDDCK